jgi:hypothetical protein
MELFNPYDAIKILGDENIALKEKIAALENENNFLKGRNEELQWFKDNYVEQKTTIITEPSEEKIDPSESTYPIMLSDYLGAPDDCDKLIELLEVFPDNIPDILIAIRNDLPDNIDDLANKYGFVKELEILRISNQKIKELKEDPAHEEWDMNKLVAEYIQNFGQHRKNVALKFLRQILTYFPFSIDKFLYDVRAYHYRDMNEIIENIRLEIYEPDKLPKPVEKPVKVKKVVSEKTGGKIFRPDYATISIDELIEFIKKVDAGHRTARIKNILLKLTENNRTAEECESFKQMTKGLIFSKYNQ